MSVKKVMKYILKIFFILLILLVLYLIIIHSINFIDKNDIIYKIYMYYNRLFITFPKVSKNCYNGNCINNQIKNDYGTYVYTTCDNLRLRYKPSLKSKKIRLLPKASRVTVIYIEDKITEINNLKGHWAFVKLTESFSNNIYGWVFDYYLSYTDKFKKVNNWRIKNIIKWAGDSETLLNCDKNGNFIQISSSFGDYYPNKSEKEQYKVYQYSGVILKYNNIIWFKIDKQTNFPVFFYLGDDHKLYLDNYQKDFVKYKYSYF